MATYGDDRVYLTLLSKSICQTVLVQNVISSVSTMALSPSVTLIQHKILLPGKSYAAPVLLALYTSSVNRISIIFSLWGFPCSSLAGAESPLWPRLWLAYLLKNICDWARSAPLTCTRLAWCHCDRSALHTCNVIRANDIMLLALIALHVCSADLSQLNNCYDNNCLGDWVSISSDLCEEKRKDKLPFQALKLGLVSRKFIFPCFTWVTKQLLYLSITRCPWCIVMY